MHWLVFSVLNAFFVSLSHALGKRGTRKLDVLSVTWAQTFFSLFLLIPFVYFTHAFQPVTPTFWQALLATSLLNTAAALLMMKALKEAPISLVAPIATLTPVFLLITSPLMVNEFPQPLGIVGIFVSVVGSYILNLNKRNKGFFEPLLSIGKEKGPREMLLVAIIWSITSNLDKIAVNNANPILYIFALTASILVFLTIILVIKSISFKTIFKNTPILAPIGLCLGLSGICQMIAISMTIVPNVIAIKRTSALFSVFWGKAFFKEENIKERLLGSAIMVLGVICIVLN